MSKSAITAAPCKHCPFRKDVPIYLRAERRDEIARSLRDGNDFPCHKTVEHDDDGDIVNPYDTTTCAGAAKALMATGGTTQMMRIAESLGMADLDKTAVAGAEVWDLNEWVLLAEGATGDNPAYDEVEEGETCSVVDEGCLAPAGYMTSSGAVEYGRDFADDSCVECGEPVCSNCISPDGYCDFCAEDLEGDA